MSYRTNSDNIYAENTLITAKENPSLKLKIMRYHQRIYYCAVVGDEQRKQLVNDAARESRAAYRSEKQAQKSRKQADKQARKASKARMISNEN